MSRPLRIQRPGLTYHLTARGNARGRIYLDDIDRCRFLEIVQETVTSYGVAVHSYCEMNNHYHLVFTTARANLSRAIRHLNGVYAQWWNRRHKRSGHVFQSRFYAQVVERDEYLLEVCRYVVLNPVRAHIVCRPEEWAWSNYRATIGLVPRPSFLADEELLARFGSVDEVDRARDAYRSFVEAGLALPITGSRLRKREPVVGTQRFAESILGRREHSTEIPTYERQQGRPTLNQLFRGAARLSARRQAMAAAHCTHDYSIRQIAHYLGLHYTTVSRAVGETRREVSGRAKTDK